MTHLDPRSWHFPSALLVSCLIAMPAAAHPHVWVAVATTVAYDGGKISGLTHRWTFDEMYTAQAIQGLDVNSDGVYSREELAELAKVNMEGLKEFGYFTFPKLGAAELKLAEPVDYWLEYQGGILTLHFTLPLAEAVMADAEGFSFSVHDPSYFIAFDMAKDKPVTLASGAPAGCAANVGVPQEDAADAQQLGEAFVTEFGGANYGLSLAKTVSITCPKS